MKKGKKYKVVKAQQGTENELPLSDPGTQYFQTGFTQDAFGNWMSNPYNPMAASYDEAAKAEQFATTNPALRKNRPATSMQTPGFLTFSPFFKTFNTLAQITTGALHTAEDIKNTRDEYRQYLESLQPTSYENPNEQGLNDNPIYTQYGGIVDYLDKNKMRSDKKFREELYGKYFGNKEKYTGTAEQNIRLLNLLEKQQSGKRLSSSGAKASGEQLAGGVRSAIASGAKALSSGTTAEAKRTTSGIKTIGKEALPLPTGMPVNAGAIKSVAPILASSVENKGIDSGVVFDKGSGKAYYIEGGKAVSSFNILTGKNPYKDVADYSRYPATDDEKVTPTGKFVFYGDTRGLTPNTVGYKENLARRLFPISGDMVNDPKWAAAVHMTPEEKRAERDPLYGSNNPFASAGCPNCSKEDMEEFVRRFPQGDTVEIYNSMTQGRKPLKKYGIKKHGGCVHCEHEEEMEEMIEMPYGGGPLTAEGAKEILRDGKANGKKLTPKQRRYFGYIAGGGKPKQFGGEDTPLVEAEEGEVYTTVDGQMNKVAEGAGTHEEGGVVLPNVERVLEDTSDKRKDRMSQALKISPKLAAMIAGVDISKPTSHSKVMEKAKEQNGKQVKKIENKLEKNVESLKKAPNYVYAQNSMDINLMNLDTIPTDAEVFNDLFDHQEFVKAALGFQNNQKAMHGGKYTIRKAQNGLANDDYRAVEPVAQAIQDTNGWTFLYKVGDKSYYKKENGQVIAVPGNQQPVVRGGKTFTAEDMLANPNRYKTFHKLMQGASAAEKLAAAKQVVEKGVWPKQYQKSGPSYGYTQTPITINPWDDGTTTGTQTPPDAAAEKTQTGLNPLNFNLKTGQPKSEFFEPLRWFDVAGPISGLISGTQRIPVKYNPAQLNQIRLKQQNPLPALQAGQTAYNSAIGNLPNTGVGNANMANLFANKYNIDNQVLGQYENINSEIKNKETMYNASVRDKQSIIDQASREVFEGKYLGSKEAQRQQILTSMDELYQRMAMNRKLNREGNLLMKLFPAFDQYADYNGYKYQFRNPLAQPQKS